MSSFIFPYLSLLLASLLRMSYMVKFHYCMTLFPIFVIYFHAYAFKLQVLIILWFCIGSDVEAYLNGSKEIGNILIFLSP